MTDEFNLVDAIDSAAKRLLDAAGFGDTVQTVESGKPTLPEQVKAFEAAVEWAKTRNVLKPPEKGKSKFDGLREQFSQTTQRRRRPVSPESSDASNAEPADTSASTDLFDA